MRIFISAGEASGDAYGAALVREIRRLAQVPQFSFTSAYGREVRDDETFDEAGVDDSLEMVEFLMEVEDQIGVKIPEGELQNMRTIRDARDIIEKYTGIRPDVKRPEITFEGVGGDRMLREGVILRANSSKWGAVSITQAAKVFFGIWTKFQLLKVFLKTGKPGLLIAIDFGFGNIRIARYAKKHGWKVLYFVPPGSWRRDKQGKDIPTLADEIVTPFEWSAEILRGMGAKAHWFGHPIKQLIRERGGETPRERTTLAVLPGSRHHELEMNLPLIAKAVGVAEGDWQSLNVPGICYDGITLPRGRLETRLEFALAPSVNPEQFKARWNQLAPGRDDLFTVGDTYGVLSRARAGIVCSGTATLEAALCRCPMVVVYQISPTMRMEAKLIGFKRPKFIALPNIILDREVVPELVEEFGVHPGALRAWVDQLLNEEQTRRGQLSAFEEIDDILGPDDGITQAAKVALQMI